LECSLIYLDFVEMGEFSSILSFFERVMCRHVLSCMTQKEKSKYINLDNLVCPS